MHIHCCDDGLLDQKIARQARSYRFVEYFNVLSKPDPVTVGASLSRDLVIWLVIWFLILIYPPLREAVRRGKAFLGTFVAV